jgi:hypothetical protein
MSTTSPGMGATIAVQAGTAVDTGQLLLTIRPDEG